jgi:hypothetical protein
MTTFQVSTVQCCLAVTREIDILKVPVLVIAQNRPLKRKCGLKCTITSN